MNNSKTVEDYLDEFPQILNESSDRVDAEAKKYDLTEEELYEIYQANKCSQEELDEVFDDDKECTIEMVEKQLKLILDEEVRMIAGIHAKAIEKGFLIGGGNNG
jgi:hypothetical protein